MAAELQSPARPLQAAEKAAGETATYLTFATGFGGGEGLTAEYLSNLGLPVTDIHVEREPVEDREAIIGTYKHPSQEHWHESIGLYYSDVGSSLIAPLWGGKADIFLIHFMILYALSIVVRYMPSLWYQIERGNLDHVLSLLEYYVTVVDTVVPKLAVERITGRKISIVNPGSLHAPI